MKDSYTIPDFYESYKRHVSEAVVFLVDYKTFRNVVIDYFNHIMDVVLEKSSDFRLPARMGTVSVIKRKPKSIQRRGHNVDFKLTNELGKTILHLNEHTNGYRFRFLWDKREVIIQNKVLYEMIMTRDNKRKLAYNIKVRKKDYIEK